MVTISRKNSNRVFSIGKTTIAVRSPLQRNATGLQREETQHALLDVAQNDLDRLFVRNADLQAEKIAVVEKLAESERERDGLSAIRLVAARALRNGLRESSLQGCRHAMQRALFHLEGPMSASSRAKGDGREQ
ncbi:hypothetical protein [Sinorhizobium chiapasense]|uniref:Uncharacterized protein n=1 Tax=Sinorhizobium chiapasense TaxID=501572 RepID=A0ABZ2BCL2_9HYPH